MLKMARLKCQRILSLSSASYTLHQGLIEPLSLTWRNNISAAIDIPYVYRMCFEKAVKAKPNGSRYEPTYFI